MSDRDTLLTITQVRAWERRAAEINAQMGELISEADDLSVKLQAARLFMPATVDGDVPAEAEVASPTRSEPEENLSETVLDAVQKIGGVPKPIAIRRRIAKNHPALGVKLATSPNYFYTVLGRHLHRGRLIKHGSGYKLPKNSPRGETGAVAAPGSSSVTPSQSVEAAHNGPKGNGML